MRSEKGWLNLCSSSLLQVCMTYNGFVSPCRLVTNVLLLSIQTNEQGDCKDGGRDPLAGEREEDRGTSRVEAPEQDSMAGEEPQPTPTHAGEDRKGDEDDRDKPSTEAEKKDEGKRKEEKLEATEAGDKTEKEQLKTEGQEKEQGEKGGGKQGQNDLEKAKDKPQFTGAEKQGKTKKKSGPPSAVSRPRTSARAIRSSAKKDIIAKFQQGAPE